MLTNVNADGSQYRRLSGSCQEKRSLWNVGDWERLFDNELQVKDVSLWVC